MTPFFQHLDSSYIHHIIKLICKTNMMIAYFLVSNLVIFYFFQSVKFVKFLFWFILVAFCNIFESLFLHFIIVHLNLIFDCIIMAYFYHEFGIFLSLFLYHFRCSFINKFYVFALIYFTCYHYILLLSIYFTMWSLIFFFFFLSNYLLF